MMVTDITEFIFWMLDPFSGCCEVIRWYGTLSNQAYHELGLLATKGREGEGRGGRGGDDEYLEILDTECM